MISMTRRVSPLLSKFTAGMGTTAGSKRASSPTF